MEDSYDIVNIIIPAVSVLVVLVLFLVQNRAAVRRSMIRAIVRIAVIFSSAGAAAADTAMFDRIIARCGYSYDEKQDIFFSAMDAWQRAVGYCRLYDEAAAPMGMIIDCEPVYFEYDNRRWLVEFWKGQYDLTTGCEIGVYTTDRPDINIPGIFNGTFYRCAGDDDMLSLSCSLIKNRPLFQREGKHWWLTGFQLGMFSEPSDLMMYIGVTLKDAVMRDAFLKGMDAAGYTRDEIRVNGNTVRFVFNRPHTAQPYTRTEKTDRVIQAKNEFLCNQYKEITKGMTTMPEKIEAVRKAAPALYDTIIDIGKSKKLFDAYKKVKRYLR